MMRSSEVAVRPQFLALIGLIAFALSHSAAASEATCSKRFSDFVAHFESDAAFQIEHIQFPLRVNYVDAGADPEPVPRIKWISRDIYASKPSYPTLEVQARRKLRKQISEVSRVKVVVRFAQPDSDGYSVEYHFEKVHGCGHLGLVDDQSL
jgi:Domain of unknown function (DUF4348)